jgi:hypothetical protein
VLLDREADKLAFEFIPAAEAQPRAPRSRAPLKTPKGKKPAAKEDV